MTAQEYWETCIDSDRPDIAGILSNMIAKGITGNCESLETYCSISYSYGLLIHYCIYVKQARLFKEEYNMIYWTNFDNATRYYDVLVYPQRWKAMETYLKCFASQDSDLANWYEQILLKLGKEDELNRRIDI